MKRKLLLALVVLMVFGVFSLAACSTSPSEEKSDGDAVAVRDAAVIQDTEFGGVYIDLTIDEFNGLGFAFGDSVDIEFSNGYALRDVPYYSGYYVNIGEPLLVGYPGYPHIKVAVNYGDSLWETAGLGPNDTATVTLAEAKKYLNVQEALDIT